MNTADFETTNTPEEVAELPLPLMRPRDPKKATYSVSHKALSVAKDLLDIQLV